MAIEGRPLETDLSEEDFPPSTESDEQSRRDTEERRTEGQNRNKEPQVNNQESLTRVQEWVTSDSCSGQKQVDRSKQKPDKSEKTQAQRTTIEPNHDPISRKEKEIKSNKIWSEKESIKVIQNLAAEITEKEHAQEQENSREDKDKEVGPTTQQNFEFVSSKPHDRTHNIGYDGPSMGLSKNTSHGKSEGAKGNVKGEQKGPEHVEKVYSRSRGCRKQMEHEHNVGLLKKANIQAHKEVSNAIDKRDEYSPEMKGTGLKNWQR